MKCPNCLGELKVHKNEDWEESRDKYDYDCTRCGRGWKVLPNGDWKQMFASNPNPIYLKEVVDLIQESDKEAESR